MICVHCGRVLQDGSRFCLYCGVPIYPQGVPGGGCGASPQYAMPPKKKKVWPWILGISMGGLVIIGILIAVAFGMLMRSLVKDSSVTSAAEKYIYAIAGADASDLTESIPDAYWSYVDSTYDVSRETMEEYLTSYLYGQDLTDTIHSPYAWITDHTYFDVCETSDSKKQTVDGILTEFALYASDYKEARSDDNSLTMVKIDAQWYPLEAMELVDELCQLAYCEDSTFSALTEEYLKSFYVQKNPELEKNVPLPFWQYLSKHKQADMTQADEQLKVYLDWLEDFYDVGEIQDVQYQYYPDEIEWYSDGKIYELDDFDLDLTCWVDIPIEIEIIGTDGSTNDETYLTMVQYDNKWYVYDYMYFCDYACEIDFSDEDGFFADEPDLFENNGDNTIV